MRTLIAASILVLALGVCAAAPVFAQQQPITVNPNLPGQQNDVAETGFAGLIGNFYQLALLISGFLAFGSITLYAVIYIASAGNPSKQSDAKDAIWQALIGLLLLAGATVILLYLNPYFFRSAGNGGGIQLPVNVIPTNTP